MKDLSDKSIVPLQRLRTINQLLRGTKAGYQREEQFKTYPVATANPANTTVVRLGQDITREIRRNAK
ncbi:MAG: hypothetical protein HQ498_08355 [Pseudohongiella sp.]|nr:hypothetical protein [Pseudohongiella sp.]